MGGGWGRGIRVRIILKDNIFRVRLNISSRIYSAVLNDVIIQILQSAANDICQNTPFIFSNSPSLR